jgi:UDP-glucose 4-epimerase
MKEKILIVGGAGYVGSHVLKVLDARHYSLVTFDNLACGHRELVKWGKLVEGNLADNNSLEALFNKENFDAVIHMAAYAYVEESVQDPRKYYDNNVLSTLCLLETMLKHRVKHIIFSSSCTVYGEPHQIPIPEQHSLRPTNPYGWTKVMVEQILKDYGLAYDLNWISLRYFNAAGADPEAGIGEDHSPETHLIPLILDVALGRRDHVKIYGHDYATPDRTCVRDFVHVLDIAQAHILALEKLFADGKNGIFNLGLNKGYSVNEVVRLCQDVTGKTIKIVQASRRPGDPPILIAQSDKAKTDLAWQPRFSDLKEIIDTAWRWHKQRFS